MKIYKIPSNNPHKVYLIKRYKCGHYYANQLIKGKVFYRKWAKLSKQYLSDVDLFPKELKA